MDTVSAFRKRSLAWTVGSRLAEMLGDAGFWTGKTRADIPHDDVAPLRLALDSLDVDDACEVTDFMRCCFSADVAGFSAVELDVAARAFAAAFEWDFILAYGL